MAGEQRSHLVEECYRLAAEARRMADNPGVSQAERDGLLEVEEGWMSLARARGGKDTGGQPAAEAPGRNGNGQGLRRPGRT